MRALVCERLEGLGALRLRDDWPEPTARAGGVVVRMHAAGLNFPDLLMTEGKYQHRAEPPYVPGLEGAGVVTSIGPDVDHTWIGRPVIVSARGTFAERVAVGIDAVTPMPDGWSFAEAAGFRVVAVTAYNALVHRARLRAGEWLLVTGASGGTGHMAVKIGKALGARVIATGTDPDKRAIVASLGADHTVDARCPDLVDDIKAATGGRGVDVVFDPVGGDGFDASLKAAAPGARIAIVGFAGGSPNTVRTNYLLIKNLTLLGIRAGEAARENPGVAEDYRTALPAFAARHDLKPRIAATLPFDEAVAAFRLLAGRHIVGKVVVTIAAEGLR
jgi:NADPH2:quinone reductase